MRRLARAAMGVKETVWPAIFGFYSVVTDKAALYGSFGYASLRGVSAIDD